MGTIFLASVGKSTRILCIQINPAFVTLSECRSVCLLKFFMRPKATSSPVKLLLVKFTVVNLLKLETIYIRGSKIRFLILPDMLKNAPMFKNMGRGRGAAAGTGGASRGKSAILRAQAARGRGRAGMPGGPGAPRGRGGFGDRGGGGFGGRGRAG